MQSSLLGLLADWYVHVQVHIRLLQESDALRNWWRDYQGNLFRPFRSDPCSNSCPAARQSCLSCFLPKTLQACIAELQSVKKDLYKAEMTADNFARSFILQNLLPYNTTIPRTPDNAKRSYGTSRNQKTR